MQGVNETGALQLKPCIFSWNAISGERVIAPNRSGLENKSDGKGVRDFSELHVKGENVVHRLLKYEGLCVGSIERVRILLHLPFQLCCVTGSYVLSWHRWSRRCWTSSYLTMEHGREAWPTISITGLIFRPIGCGYGYTAVWRQRQLYWISLVPIWCTLRLPFTVAVCLR